MNFKILTGMGLAFGLCACVTTPQPNAALESAHAAVQAAEADPYVSKYAALDLEAAKTDLAAADDAALHHRDVAIAHLAYLAAQNARLARMHAAAKADDARVAAGQADRDRIMLAARNREVASARMATNEAKMETNDAKMAANDAKMAANEALNERDQATLEAARLQAEVDQLKATPTPRGLVMTLGDVLFDTGRSELNPGASRKLDQLAQFLSEHRERRVQIDGFTDSVGTESYNEELSRRRADAVKSALTTRGVDASRISTQGYGKAYPVANNSDSGGRQLNRRVEVVIGGDSGNTVAPRS
jgi:outer membrane protein OmpA-like peptidoglycan-associated protein